MKRKWVPFFFLLGCGGSQTIDRETLAVADPQSCSEARVSWDADPATPADQKVCSGPWAYYRYKAPCLVETTTNGPGCTVENQTGGSCTDYNTCRYPTFPSESATYTPTVTGTDTTVCTGRPPNRDCNDVIAYDNRVSCATWQSRYLTNALNQVQDGPNKASSVRVDVAVEHQDLSTVNNVTHFREICHLTVTRPQALKRPECGTFQYACPMYLCPAPVHSCGIDLRTTYYSAPQLRSAAVSDPDAKRETLTCTTCDDLAMQGDGDVQRKADCLLTQVGDPAPSMVVADPSIVSRLVTKLELLFELRGDQLSDDQKNRIIALYGQYPALSTACGDATPPMPAPPSGCYLIDLQSTLAACQHLSGTLVPGRVTRAFLSRCISGAAKVAQLACRPDDYVSLYAAALRSLFDHAWAQDPTLDASGISLADALVARLQLLSAWYDAAKQYLYPTPDARPNLLRDAGAIVGSFEKGAHAQAFGLDPSGVTIGRLDSLFDTSMATDRNILLALYSNPPPLTTTPLLYLTSDALHGLAVRADATTPYHDVACRYLGCAPAPATPLSEAWSLLSALPDASALDTALSSTTHFGAGSSDPTDWKHVFSAIHDRHAAFESAVVEATAAPSYSPDLLGVNQPLPEPAIELAKVVGKAAQSVRSYARNGLFRQTDLTFLRGGIAQQRKAALEQDLDRLISGLDSARQDRSNQLQTLVQNLLTQMRNQGDQQNISNQIAQSTIRFNDLDGRLMAMEGNIAVDDARFASFIDAFQSMVASGAVDLNRMVTLATQPALTVTAAQAKWDPQQPNLTIPQIAAVGASGPQVVHLRAGQILNIDVSGNWAPTCALQETQVELTPQSPPIHIQTDGVTTGPEGFTVDTQNGAMVAHGYETMTERSDYDGYSDSHRDCSSQGLSLMPTLYGLGLGNSWNSQDCEGTDSGYTNSNRTQSSNNQVSDQRTSASFNAGLRLPFTPFPEAPVGALLAVVVAPGGSIRADVRDVQVVQRHSSILVPQDADVYLVANDIAATAYSPNCVLAPDAMTVSMTILVPVAQEMQAVGTAMATTYASILSHTDAAAAQGALLPAESTELERSAWSSLATSCGCDTSLLPDPVRTLFGTWVSHALTRMQRVVEIRNLERDRHLANLELIGLHNQLEQAQSQSRLIQLLPSWSLETLSSGRMDDEVAALTDLLSENLYPILHLRYPAVLGRISTTNMQTNLQSLLAADLNVSPTVMAQTLGDFSSSLRDAFASSSLSDPNLSVTTIALGFPNGPGWTAADDSIPARWPRVDAARAAQFWSGVQAGRTTLTINAEDLYRRAAGQGVLGCDEEAPIVEAMAAVLVTRDTVNGGQDPLNNPPWRVPMEAGPTLSIATNTTLESYTIADDWRFDNLRLLFGPSTQVGPLFDSYVGATPPPTVGDGLSPFTNFTLDLSSLAARSSDVVPRLKEAVLLFRVEARRVAPPSLQWLNRCSP